jgi:hypothetical protein
MATPQNELTEEAILPGMPDEPEIIPAEEIEGLDLSGETTVEEVKDEPAEDPARLREEVEARAHNWVDRDEWIASGKDPKFWNDAASFNDFNRKSAAVQSRENRELRQRLDRMERDQRIKEDAEREARQNLARQSLALELKQAREDNDWDKAFEVQNKILDLRFAEETTPKAKPNENPEAVAAFNAFLSANPVLKTDEKLQRAVARQVKLIIDANGPGQPAEVLSEAWDEVKRMYPERFRKSTAPPMADTGGTQSRQVNGRDWNSLKPQVKAEYEKFLRDNPGIKRENILKRFPDSYFRS